MGESPEGHSGIHFANQDPVFKMEVIETSKKQLYKFIMVIPITEILNSGQKSRIWQLIKSVIASGARLKLPLISSFIW